MIITVRDLNNIETDDGKHGNVVDILINHADTPGLKEAVLKACNDWHDGQIASLHEAHKAEKELQIQSQETMTKRLTDDHKAKVAEVQSHLDSAREVHASATEKLKADHAEALAKLQAELDEHKSQVQALGGTELAQRLKREADIRAAEQALAAATKRHAELTAV